MVIFISIWSFLFDHILKMYPQFGIFPHPATPHHIMSYAILTCSYLYPAFEQYFLNEHPEISGHSYKNAYRSVLETLFSRSTFYAPYLEKLGNRVLNLFPECSFLQKKWAQEAGMTAVESTNASLERIFIEQIRQFKPDAVFLQNPDALGGVIPDILRRECRSLRLLTGYKFSPAINETKYRSLDIILTGNTVFADRYRAGGITAEVVPHAFEPEITAKLQSTKNAQEWDFTFVGAIGKPHGAHSNRYALITTLLENTCLELWATTERTGGTPYLKDMTRYSLYTFLRMLGVHTNRLRKFPFLGKVYFWPDRPQSGAALKKFEKRIHRPVFGKKYYRILADSRVCLNCHIDIAKDSSGNVRMFEATGLGSCLLTDRKSTNSDFFQADKEIVEYTTAEECREKVTWLLQHEKERRAIADAGKCRTLKEHTVEHRALLVDDIIRRSLRSG